MRRRWKIVRHAVGRAGHRGWIGIAAIVALGGLVAASDALHRLVTGIAADFELLVGLHPLLSLSAYLLLTALSAMLSFFSTAVLVPLAVHAWGGWETFLLHWGGSLLGGLGAYAVGRLLGRRVANAVVGAERVSFWSARLGTRASFGVVLLLQIALQSEIPGYVLGTLRYRFPLFIGALALGTLPYALGMIYLGNLFLDRRPVLLVLVAALGIGLAVWAISRLHRVLAAPSPADEAFTAGGAGALAGVAPDAMPAKSAAR